MTIPDTADLWWKNAVVYCLDVQTFADSNGDGIGDFGGLTAHVDDLAGLGVTCIWLMPFYPTADQDDGYDVADHYAVDPRLGTFGDFTEFMSVAADRGLRVIADLVVNHTSDQHAWFQSARRSRESPFRNFYVWQDEIPDGGPTGVVFPGEQEGVWTFDTEAGQYYLHRFYRHQPDLNVANEAVRTEITKVMGFWLAQGLAGFRVDAVPFLLETAGIDEVMEIAPHQYLRDLRAFLQRRRGDAVLLGEVNLPFDQQRRFFGNEDGDELNLLFDFMGMQATYLAMARGRYASGGVAAEPARDPTRVDVRVVPAQPRRVDARQAHRRRTRGGLRRIRARPRHAALRPRAASSTSTDARWQRRPDPHGLQPHVLHAGDAHALLRRGDRDGREPRHRRATRRAHADAVGRQSGAGFTSAPPDAACRPFPDGDYAPDRVSVEAQRTDPESLLNWFERLIRLRKRLPEVGWGDVEVLDAGIPAVLALRFDWEGKSVVTMHNLSSKRAAASVDVDDHGVLRDLIGTSDPIPVKDGTATVKLAGYGYRWFRLGEHATST